MIMEHIWKTIPGFFTFPQFYSWLAKQMPTDKPSCGVEIGAFHGQSAAYLAVELINRGVPCKLDLVDTFNDGDNARPLGATLSEVVKDLEPVRSIIDNIRPCLSWDAATFYEDKSLDFVMIDADHSYGSVRRDIDAWLPKVKPGGIIAGHDYIDFAPLDFGVMKAVNETFERFEVWPGITNGGDQQMQGKYWPVWCARPS